jgi:Ser/Thr protein kinase RdoA (MazF antagonist)
VLVTSLLVGGAPRRTPGVLRRLGESIGRLYALPPVSPQDGALTRPAGAMPREDLAFGLTCLERVAHRVPTGLRAAHAALREALESTRDCEDLPPGAHGLLHSDCHLTNAVEADDGGVAWFDWDGVGVGPRIAALGLLLYSCAVQAPGEHCAPMPAPDPSRITWRVEAVLAGYLAHHRPSAAELHYLPDGVRFRPAVVAARSLAEAVERGVAPDDTGWWARYAAADLVAASARRVLG